MWLNVLTGNLDRPGGAMFPLAAAGASNAAGEPGKGPWGAVRSLRQPFRGLGEIFGELPVVCLSEEIGPQARGQVRALITISGKPRALKPEQRPAEVSAEDLDFIVSLARVRQRDGPARRS